MKKLTLLTALCLTLSANANCINAVTTTSGPFTVNNDNNTVTDNITGLTWMRCSLGQTGSDCNGGSAQSYTWAGALNEVASSHRGWRLPNIKELRSIAELKCFQPAIDPEIFPNTLSNEYWSSSPVMEIAGLAWIVNFDNGNSYHANKDSGHHVRLVRSSSGY